MPRTLNATYDPEAEAVYVYLSGKPHARTVELLEGVNVDLDAEDQPIGVEVLNVARGDRPDTGERERPGIDVERLALAMDARYARPNMLLYFRAEAAHIAAHYDVLWMPSERAAARFAARDRAAPPGDGG